MKIHPYWKEQIKARFEIKSPSRCLECLHFVSCESPKQAFHKSTGIECDEFEKTLTKDEKSATITNDR